MRKWTFSYILLPNYDDKYFTPGAYAHANQHVNSRVMEMVTNIPPTKGGGTAGHHTVKPNAIDKYVKLLDSI